MSESGRGPAWGGRTPLGRSRTAVISTHYYPSYLKRSLGFVQHAVSRLQAVSCVLVAGQPELAEGLAQLAARLDCQAMVCNHDNVGLEFGAYQRGLESLTRIGEFDWVVILNDSCSVHQAFSGERLKNITLQIQARAVDGPPAILGGLENLERSFVLCGSRTHRWVTSNLLALNRAAVEGLDGRLYCSELECLIRVSADIDEFFGPGIDPVLKDHISAWLFDPAAVFHWYRAAHLQEANSTMFALKARSILQEMHLSARLEAQSAAFVDIKWLRRWQRWVEKLVPVVGNRRQRET